MPLAQLTGLTPLLVPDVPVACSRGYVQACTLIFCMGLTRDWQLQLEHSNGQQHSQLCSSAGIPWK
jgi:hypothetical protein